jgi:hypothetical protein
LAAFKQELSLALMPPWGRARAEMVLGTFAETKVSRRSVATPRKNKPGFLIKDVGNGRVALLQTTRSIAVFGIF